MFFIPEGFKEYEVVIEKYDYFFGKGHVRSTHYVLGESEADARARTYFAHGDVITIISITEEVE